MTSALVETPSGKGAGDENFPVGSFLLPAPLRPHVATFYAFARAADDIADNPDLAPEDKVQRLDGFDRALTGAIAGEPGYEKCYRMRESLTETGVTAEHCRDLLRAFKQDALKPRYRDWDDLMGYCYLSAAPVGRYLLDLHGESPTGYPAADALCNALQVLNHLQDLKDDYRNLDRVYLPGDWLARNGVTVEALDAPAASPGLRHTIDAALDATAGLVAEAEGLVPALKNRRLAMESAVIWRLARRLLALLRAGDPIAGRVALTKGDFVRCGVGGVFAVFAGRR